MADPITNIDERLFELIDHLADQIQFQGAMNDARRAEYVRQIAELRASMNPVHIHQEQK